MDLIDGERESQLAAMLLEQRSNLLSVVRVLGAENPEALPVIITKDDAGEPIFDVGTPTDQQKLRGWFVQVNRTEPPGMLGSFYRVAVSYTDGSDDHPALWTVSGRSDRVNPIQGTRNVLRGVHTYVGLPPDQEILMSVVQRPCRPVITPDWRKSTIDGFEIGYPSAGPEGPCGRNPRWRTRRHTLLD